MTDHTVFGTGYAIAVYVALNCLLTVVAVGTYSETRQRDLGASVAAGAGRGPGPDR